MVEFDGTVKYDLYVGIISFSNRYIDSCRAAGLSRPVQRKN